MEPKKKKQRTLGAMFGHKPSTLPKKTFRGVPLQGVGLDFWYARESVLIRRMPNCNYNSPKVASFDFDSCLVDDTTWQWNANKPLPIRPGVIEKLRTLHQENYRLVIFTNEKTISMRKEKKSIENAINKKISRLNEFVRTLGCPMEMFVATGGDGDEYRKGSTPGMWNLLSEDCTKYGDSTCIKNDVPPNVSESFFVGDAAGRASDHSNTDLLFAYANKIAFHTETAYFPLSTPQGSHINELFCLGGVQMVLILVGRPGSGKSMFAQSVLNNDRNGETWEVACQDDLGTRQKCEHLVNETLLEKKNIIIDRTNISIEQRATWIQSGFQQDLCNIVVAVFGEDMDKRELISNVTTRTEHPTLNSQNAKYVIDQMTNNYATPTLSEGIDLIFHVPSKLNEREMFSTELQKWSESRNGSGTKYESGGDTSVSSTSSSSSTSSKSSAANSATKSTTTTSTSSTSSFSSSSSISTKEPKQDMPLPSSYPPTFAFVPMEIKAGTQDHPSATSTEHINTILTTATTFLNEHTTFNVELILNTLNDTEHENMYTLLTKDPTTSSLLSTLATFKTTNSEDRFRILNNINMSEYPLLLNSKASIVSTPAVMKFMPGGTDLNKNVHRMYAVAHGCGKSSTQALSVETLNRHKHFKKNESYVVDVPIQLIATGKLQRSSNRTTVTQIIHTMQTNNPLEAYTNMFGTMQRNYESPDYTPPPSTSGSSSLSFSSSFTSNDPSRTSSSSLIANSKCFTLKAIPRSYTPPEGKPVRSGNWSKVLNDYLSSTLTDRQASQIFMQTSRFVVLYDGYPKSTLHLLFIPRPVYLNKLYPDNCQAYDLRKLKLLHLAAKEIQQHMEQWWCGGGSGSVVPEGTGINVGYHEKPSLERMHIHLISNNFESVNMKTKKHRDSFQTDFFVDIDKFIGMVAERV